MKGEVAGRDDAGIVIGEVNGEIVADRDDDGGMWG